MGKLRMKIDFILKHNPVVYKLFYIFGSFFLRIVGIFCPIKKNRILFTAHGRLYNDSPKFIYEYIIKNSEYDNYELIWGIENPNKINIPGRAKKIKIDTLSYFCVALSSKYWVTCVNIERGLHFKKKKTIFLNTWHGFPIKGTGINSKRKAINYSYINYFCVAGDFDKKYYSNCFSIPESHFLMSGFPRMDELYNCTDEEKKIIRNMLCIPEGKKVILYAPTWRDSQNKGKDYCVNIPADFEKWERVLSDEYILLMRLHPYTNRQLKIKYNYFIRDYSNYENINDLLKISDILISDYSGTIFEYSALKRPIICFGFDIESYIMERGLSIDVEKELPGGVIKTEDEVLSRIKNLNYDRESMLSEALLNKYIPNGGNATKICVETLLSKK